MFCGSFSHVDEDEWSPRRSKREIKNKNPYSNSGLDKFARLLAELEVRREKIMAQMGPEEVIPLVRFAYSNSNNWIPIVVKPRCPKHEVPKKADDRDVGTDQTEGAVESTPPEKLRGGISEKDIHDITLSPPLLNRRSMKKNLSGSLKEEVSGMRWRPTSYWPLILILIMILVCLVIFGRSFAIICTSIGWYLVPSFKGTETGKRSSMKYQYGRKMNGKKETGDDGFKTSPRPPFTGS